MEREHLRPLFKDDLLQIISIIMLISSWISNELGQILKKLCKYNYSLPIYGHFSAIFESKFWPKR